MINKPHPKSLFDVLIHSYEYFGSRDAFIYRAAGEEFQVTYEKFFDDVLILARAFKAKKIGHGSKVMLLSDNRYGWMVTDMALISLGAISVPRGSDTPTRELQYIMEHSECEYLVSESPQLLAQHQEMLSELSALKVTFIIEAADTHRPFQSVYSYHDILKDRTISPDELSSFISQRHNLESDDVVTLIYTSGTTGNPKGVLLTHSNLIHQIESLPQILALTEKDRWLSILPAWHIFERTQEHVALATGCCIVYSALKTFSDDLLKYQPSIVATVPRLWESLYSKVNIAVEKQGKGKAKLFARLIQVSVSYRKNLRILRDQLPCFEPVSLPNRVIAKIRAAIVVLSLYPLYLVAQKKLTLVRQKFGGKLRIAISGGGSLPQYLDEWIDAIDIRIANAYGMTECAPGIAGRGIDCEIFGTIGKPIDKTELRIVDSHGDEVANGTEGDIQVRGPQVMPGYFKNDAENEKAFTADGFFKTGDLGKLTLSGELVLCGRSKEIIVLANGENVDPTRIESTISMLPFVTDALLVGQDKKGLGALIVPDREKLKEFVAEKFSSVIDDAENFLHDKRVIAKVKQEINKLLHPKQGFKVHERLQNVRFLEKGFESGDELTNTMKKKRHVIEKKYHDLIDRLLK